MKTFTDAAGRTWTLSLTLGSALRVKDTLGIDLLQPEVGEPDAGGPLLTRLGTDELLLGEVICCLLASQFEAHQVTGQQVREAFDGKTLLAAQKAFYEELMDFFQGRGRADRARAVAAQAQLIETAVRAITTRIEAIDPAKVVDQAMAEAEAEGPSRGSRSGSSPAALASTRDP